MINSFQRLIVSLMVLAMALCLPIAAGAGDGKLPPRATVDTDSGGYLMPEQRAYDVRFYDLDLRIQPEEHAIAGTLTVRASRSTTIPSSEQPAASRQTATANATLPGQDVTVQMFKSMSLMWSVHPIPSPKSGQRILP